MQQGAAELQLVCGWQKAAGCAAQMDTTGQAAAAGSRWCTPVQRAHGYPCWSGAGRLGGAACCCCPAVHAGVCGAWAVLPGQQQPWLLLQAPAGPGDMAVCESGCAASMWLCCHDQVQGALEGHYDLCFRFLQHHMSLAAPALLYNGRPLAARSTQTCSAKASVSVAAVLLGLMSGTHHCTCHMMRAASDSAASLTGPV